MKIWNHYASVFLLVIVLAGLTACTTTEAERLSGVPLSDEPLTGKFVWHDLISDDVAQSREFYGGLFGWSFEDTTRPGGGDYTLISHKGRYVAGIVHLDDPADADYSRWLGYLSVSNVDHAVDFTRSEGGEAAVEPFDLGEVGRAAAIIDPQGAVLGLVRSRLGDPDDSIRRGVGEIVWNELLAADDMAAVEFYGRLAGLQAKDETRPGGTYRTMVSQGQERSGILTRPAEDMDPFWLTHFAVENVHASTDKVAALGGKVLLAPSDEVRNGLFALITDPSGAVLALHQWTE